MSVGSVAVDTVDGSKIKFEPIRFEKLRVRSDIPNCFVVRTQFGFIPSFDFKYNEMNEF